jgi:dTMP kinase
MKRGTYIVIEGLDGSGKTTQHQRVLEHIGTSALGVREPGGTPMAEQLRTLIKDKTVPRSARTNVFLFSAARVELIDTIVRPAIHKGQHVVADRNWLSTIAYQSAEGVKNEDEIYKLCKLATEEFFEPDLLIFIDTDVSTCRARLKARADTATDYFDELGSDYFAKVRNAYLAHIKKLPRYQIIDGNGTPDQVARQITTVLQPLL